MTDDELLKDQWFGRYLEAKHAEAIYTRQKEEWLDRATSVTKELSDMPRSASANIYTDDAYVARLDCAAEADRQVKAAQETMDSIEKVIRLHPDALCRDWLRYRYVDGLTMLQTSIRMEVDERSAYRLKHRALDYYHIIQSEGSSHGYALLPDSFYHPDNKSDNRLSMSVYVMSKRAIL